MAQVTTDFGPLGNENAARFLAVDSDRPANRTVFLAHQGAICSSAREYRAFTIKAVTGPA